MFDDIDKKTNVLLLNPPIADAIEAEEMNMVGCHDSVGLLRLASFFRRKGCNVQMLDCLRDKSLNGNVRRHVRKTLPAGEPGGQVYKEIYHFGLDSHQLQLRLREFERPDLIAISALFTWHTEVLKETIRTCKELYPDTKVLLGGNFPTLCPQEAEKVGADEVFAGDVEGAELLPVSIDLVSNSRNTSYIRMIKGCPHKCSYCITNFLNKGKIMARSPEDVFEEIKESVAKYNVKAFMFFDDFILFRQAEYLEPLLDKIIESKIDVNLNFNAGISAYMVSPELVKKLRMAGAGRLTLALETISPERNKSMNRPQGMHEFVSAVNVLQENNYRGEKLKAFYLIGLPDQTIDEIYKAILFLYSLGVTPNLTTYTMTPGSGDMKKYGDRITWSSLDELSPWLWRFASEQMPLEALEKVYRIFRKNGELGRFAQLV